MGDSDVQLSALQAAADKVGLDRAAFDKCVESREFKAAVDLDMEAAVAAGVTGTPSFFINGRLLDGAQPFEAFRSTIEEELAWAKR
jgi:predicted DsbA family dithiol-disulfide isomerase